MGGHCTSVEEAVVAALDAGDHASAAGAVVSGYGPEILGFVWALLRHEDDARDAFGEFCVAMLKGLAGFERRASVRVWAFTIARHTALRYRAAPHRRPERNVALSAISQLSAMAERVRTETMPYLRTEQKERFSALRAALPEEDQTLLILRVDKALEWKEIARVMLGIEADAETLRIESARLRKRFQLLKEKLRRLGEREGLV